MKACDAQMAFLLLIAILELAALRASPPAEVRLGGLFPSFRTSGSVIIAGQQRMAAFLMAVKEINANPHILPNTTIKIAVRDTRLHAGKAFLATLDMVTNAFNKSGIDGCIGAATSAESDAASDVLTQYSTVQVSYSSTSSILSSRTAYPFFARTCPADTFQGAAIADLVFNRYGWLKVSTFANSDTYGSSGISQFQTSAIDFGVEILSSSLTPVGQINFAIPIAEAMKSGSRIFIFFMDAHDMGLLIAQGYAAGLFSEGTQIIASDAGLSASVWAMMPPSEVTKMMKGVLVFSPTSGYASPQASKFLKAYLSQSNTVQDPLTGLCNDRTDDSGGINRYLFKEALDLRAPNVFTCSGTNFTSLKADGSDLDNYVSYTYDATYALARAMHVVLYLDKSPKITGEALYSALIKNVSFVGTTGLVNFSRALTLDGSRFGEGDRRTGVTYEILNFNSDYYSSDLHHALGFVKVGQWTVERGNQFTSSVSYNTADNSPPSYRLPTIFLTMVVSEVRILQSLSAILFVLCSIVTGTLIKNRSTKLVKSMQLRMQLLMLIGMYCGLTRVLIGSFRVTERNCSANEWLGHLSFWFLISPMMLKAWRVHIIVNNKTLKRVTVTEWCITKIFLFIITVVILYLTIMQVLPSATSITIISESIIDNQVYSSTECHKRNFGYALFLYLTEAILLVITAALCHVTKHVPGGISEAKNYLKVTFVTACGGIILLLFSKFPPPISESSHEFITSLGFFIVVAISIVQCYSCSTCMLLSGYDVSRDQQIVKRRSSTSTASQGVESIRFLGDNQYGGSSNVNPFEAIKTRNLLARKQTCEEQLRHWSEMLRNTEALMVSQAEMVKNGSLAAITATRIVPHSEVDNIEIFRASNKNSVERNVSAYTALSLSATPSVSPMRTVGHVDSGHETVEQNQEQLQVQDQAPQSRAI